MAGRLIESLSWHMPPLNCHARRQPANSSSPESTDPYKPTLFQFCKTMSGDYSTGLNSFDPYPYMKLENRGVRLPLRKDQLRYPELHPITTGYARYVLYDHDQNDIWMFYGLRLDCLLTCLERTGVGIMFEIRPEMLHYKSRQCIGKYRRIIVGIHRRLPSVFNCISEVTFETFWKDNDLSTPLIESSAEVYTHLAQGIFELNINQEQSRSISSYFPSIQADSNSYQDPQSITATMGTSLLFEQLVLKNSPLSRRFIAAIYGAQPKFTAVQLIALAIKAAGHPLTEREVHEWFKKTFPYFQGEKSLCFHRLSTWNRLQRNKDISFPLFETEPRSGEGVEKMWNIHEHSVNSVFENLYSRQIYPFWRHMLCFQPRMSSTKFDMSKHIAETLPTELVVSILKFIIPGNEKFIIGMHSEKHPALFRLSYFDLAQRHSRRNFFGQSPRQWLWCNWQILLAEPVDLNEFLEEAKGLAVGKLLIEIFFTQNVFLIGGVSSRSPSKSRAILESIGEDICSHIRKVIFFINLSEDGEFMEKSLKMLQCIGKMRLMYLKVRIFTESRALWEFKHSIIGKFLCKFRDVLKVEFELLGSVSACSTQWVETINAMRVQMTSYRPGGRSVCSVAQPPVKADEIMHWPSGKRGKYKEASKAYFESFGHIRNPGELKEECKMIAEYMQDVWDKEDGTHLCRLGLGKYPK